MLGGGSFTRCAHVAVCRCWFVSMSAGEAVSVGTNRERSVGRRCVGQLTVASKCSDVCASPVFIFDPAAQPSLMYDTMAATSARLLAHMSMRLLPDKSV